MENPLVSIIILNWNGNGLIQECLDSLRALEYKKVEIIVVDNGSTDASLPYLQQRKDIILVRNGTNYGFAKGNNIGFEIAKGKYFAILNNDIVVEPFWLNEPIRYLEQDAQIGIISCRQMNYYKRDIIDGLYHYAHGALKFNPFGDGLPFVDGPEYSEPGFVISANGGSAIFRKVLIDQIGGFDERFYAYCEDTDLAMRAFLHSWKCLYVPQAVVYHRNSASFGKNPSKRMFFVWRNRYFFLYKYFPIRIIVRQIRWVLWNEWRTFGHIFFKLRNPLLYPSIWMAIVKGIGSFAADRKRNLSLFTEKEKEFLPFLRNKIYPLGKKEGH